MNPSFSQIKLELKTKDEQIGELKADNQVLNEELKQSNMEYAKVMHVQGDLLMHIHGLQSENEQLKV